MTKTLVGTPDPEPRRMVVIGADGVFSVPYVADDCVVVEPLHVSMGSTTNSSLGWLYVSSA